MKFRFLLALVIGLNSAAAFELTTYQEEIPESNPVTRIRIKDGKTQFSFAAPPGWSPATDVHARRVSLQSTKPPLGAIIIQIATNSMPANAAEWRQQATNRFKGSTIVQEFQASSGASPGLGVDLRHTVSANYTVFTRLCIFKTPDGAVEINLSTKPDDIDAVHPYWTGFINSFRVEPQAPPPEQK